MLSRQVRRATRVLVAAACALAPASALADRDVAPLRHDTRAVRGLEWAAGADWAVSSVESTETGGTRVAALVDVDQRGAALQLEARGLDGDAVGPWLAMEETFRGSARRVAVVDLGEHWPSAQIRLAADDDSRVEDLAWELLVPRYPDAGRRAREAVLEQPDVSYALGSELQPIGVVSREAWGARATQCSSTEDDWYRMAVHHTAGSQTSGGSVQGAVRALQAYAQDSGGYCDIPYQLLIGYDGSLWEGRPLQFRSGATGGGQNDGNLAISFLGCYHSSSCPGGVSHAVTEEMMASARLLTQTVVRMHAIPSNADSIRAHRDWPDNSTVCPGDGIYPRLGELRADLAWYAAQETARSFSAPGGAPLQAVVGESVEVWVELRNTGGLTWEPGVTFLGTTGERDSSSELHDPSWLSPSRAATVDAPVAPGAVGRFSFRVKATAPGDWQQSFGLVQEWVTWFGDAPWGGGPGDNAVVVAVHAVSDVPEVPDDPGGPDGPDDPGDGPDGVGADSPEDDATGAISGGCSAGQRSGRGAPAGLVSLLVLLGAFAVRSRRRLGLCQR